MFRAAENEVNAKTHSKKGLTSKMEIHAKIFHGFQWLTNFFKKTPS